MAISLTPELEHIVHQKLATGRYKSAEDVLSAALRALNEEEETIAAISEGWEDVVAGRVEPWELADAEFRKKHGLPGSR
jgi:antitoxin ParD1/3/4